MVIPMVECPKIVCKVFGFIPFSIQRVANVCLSVCIEKCFIPILSQ